MTGINNAIGNTFKDRMALIKNERNKSVFIATKDIDSMHSMDDSGNDMKSPTAFAKQ